MTDHESNWRQATKAQCDLVDYVRALIEEYYRLYGTFPTSAYLLKQVGLVP